jgi:hypothetical protein
MGTARIVAPTPAPTPAPRAAPVEPRSSGGRTLAIAAAVVVAGIAGIALWQFGGFNRIAPPTPAAQAAPAVTTPVAATPDVGPSISNVASVPQWGNGASTPKPVR